MQTPAVARPHPAHVIGQSGLETVVRRKAGGFSLGMRQRLGIAAVSGGRVTVRTTARPEAMTVLAHAGATVGATDGDALIVSGLAAERVVALLGESAVPFSEVSAHRATLEEAYMELTRDVVEFRAAAAEGAAR